MEMFPDPCRYMICGIIMGYPIIVMIQDPILEVTPRESKNAIMSASTNPSIEADIRNSGNNGATIKLGG